MRSLSILNLVCIANLLLAPCLVAQTSNCICSGFNKSRVESEKSFPDGDVFNRVRDNLKDPDYFGPSGLVSRSISISAGALNASEASLSSVNVFITGLASTSSYTNAEKAALKNAVINNGMSLVVTADDPQHNIADLFDAALDPNGSEVNQAVLEDHPIFAGPFGRITYFRGAEAAGNFRSWPAGGILLASNGIGPSMVLIPKGALGINAGAVLLISDIDQWTTHGRDLGTSTSEPSLPVTDALVMNIIAFLCNPNTLASAPHMVFPQFANGQNNVSSLNLTSASPVAPLGATVSFRDDNGQSFLVPIVNQGPTSSFIVNLTPNQTVSFFTDGVGALRSGWAAVRSSSFLAGNVMFFAPGLGATSVGASPMAGGFLIPVVQQPRGEPTPGAIEVYTGVAICNLSAKTAHIRTELWDNLNRRADGTAFLTLRPYGHTATFLNQLYPGFDFRGFRGTFRVISRDGLISATGLQLGSAPGQFTALPIKPMYR